MPTAPAPADARVGPLPTDRWPCEGPARPGRTVRPQGVGDRPSARGEDDQPRINGGVRTAMVSASLTEVVGAIVLAAGLVLIIALLAAMLAARRLTAWAEGQLGDATRRGPAELVYTLGAVPLRALLLTAERARHGRPAAVAMESPLIRRWLDEVRFDPATLAPDARPPHPATRLAVDLGPLAPHPLRLSWPLLVTGMGLGAGVSDDVRQVLAEAAAVSGVPVNAGEGPALPVELETEVDWVWQWGRGSWEKAAATLPAAMIELHVGQESEGGTAVSKPRRYLPRVLRQQPGFGGRMHIAAGLPEPLGAWVRRARAAAGGQPVAVKLPASQHLERDLARVVRAGADVAVLDSAGAGTAGSAAALTDNLGIPAAVAVVRAARWLRHHGQRGRLSLVLSGQVHDSADIAKLLALGADAVAVGSIALIALSHGQATRPLPAHGPSDLVFSQGSRDRQVFDRDLAAERLADWFAASRAELDLLCQALGLGDVRDLGPRHLVADTPLTARALQIAWYGAPSPAADTARALGRVRDQARRTLGSWNRLLGADRDALRERGRGRG